MVAERRHGSVVLLSNARGPGSLRPGSGLRVVLFGTLVIGLHEGPELLQGPVLAGQDGPQGLLEQVGGRNVIPPSLQGPALLAKAADAS